MASRTAPLLHRDDPAKDPLTGATKVTRRDWLNRARDVLVTEGVAEVKILSLAQAMQVSRSSFYWYFENRDDLLSALLEEWEARNTAQIVKHCAMQAEEITEGCCNFFRCFLDPTTFDHGLDFAIREWTRRDPELRARVDAADARRIEAVTDMFRRFEYPDAEADARARILYFMQLGYHALEVREDMATRMSRVDPYLTGFTGRPVNQKALSAFKAFVDGLEDA